MENSENDGDAAVDSKILNSLKQYVSTLCSVIFQGTSGVLNSLESDDNAFVSASFISNSDARSLFVTRAVTDGKFGM